MKNLLSDFDFPPGGDLHRSKRLSMFSRDFGSLLAESGEVARAQRTAVLIFGRAEPQFSFQRRSHDFRQSVSTVSLLSS